MANNLFREMEQLKAFSPVHGAQLIYELGRQVIYSGLPPWFLNAQDPAIDLKFGPKIRQGVEPFTTIRAWHKRPKAGNNANDHPIITSGDGENPQFDEYLGVDFVTLVAQMLHDPATNPPKPFTDLGPRTL
jgi:hypothetical protein